MSGLVVSSSKTLMLFSGRAFPELASEIGAELDTPLGNVTLGDFPNGEMYCRFEESVRGCDAFVIQSHTEPINKWLMEQLIMVDALKRASAKRISVVAPFYPYARQDKKTLAREPISARLIADLFTAAGADRIISIDLHTAQIQGFLNDPLDHLTALPMLSDYIAER
ncbi:MAG TPA: ribose-phosphate diphosphokinase, partial [Solirubrobacteraceae bacterium]|nr:ribose-phosphate diphosphokinase [Solirubrobacteraceae bacterium]